MITLSIFTTIAGFVIGLGAVTIIDIHGFLGRKSSYWTEATTRTHKVTKPLIWVGIALVSIGFTIFYRPYGWNIVPLIHCISIIIMVLNGIFLTFSVSPFLIKKEKEGKSRELLSKDWQNKITISFITSFIFWWGNVLLFSYFIAKHLS